MVEDVVKALGYLCLGTRMKRIGEALQAQTQRVIDASKTEISASQFPYLASIDRLGPLTIGDLAEAIGIAQPGATRAVKHLIENGYLASEASSDDQRRRMVKLTERGQALVNFAKINTWPLIDEAVADLCGHVQGPILAQLAGVEDGLNDRSLEDRIAKKGRIS